jgi:putative restriction endonuclease
MSREAVLRQFDGLGVWSRGGERAPHKPLLILYALARWSRGDQSPVPFADVNRDLTPLLKEFGPPRRQVHPEYPFWYLKSDGVWVVHAPCGLKMRKGKDQPPKGELLAANAAGGFSPGVQAALRAEPALVAEVAFRLLEGHFPESIHADILSAVGLDPAFGAAGVRRRRDPAFRKWVLTAYEYGCAVCGLDVRLGTVSVALDAAHVRWHQAGGPDTEANGLALCALHHKTFDLGVFTLSDGGLLLVSEEANGTTGFNELLLRYHGLGSARRSGRSGSRPRRTCPGTARRCSRESHAAWPDRRKTLSVGPGPRLTSLAVSWALPRPSDVDPNMGPYN